MKKDSFEKKFAAYVATAAAFLAAQKESNAQVMYTDVNPDLVIENSFFNLDLNNDGVDFKLKNTNETIYYPDGGGCNACGGLLSGIYNAQFNIEGNNQVMVSGLGNLIMPLAAGDTVTPSNSFGNGYVSNNIGVLNSSGFNGSFSCWGGSSFTSFNYPVFMQNIDSYIGFKINSGGQNHYGWARIRLGNNNVITLKDYAINPIADSSIVAGDTVGVGCSVNNLGNFPSGNYWMCNNSVDVHLYHANAQNIQWMENGSWLSSANDSVYTVTQTGTYLALVSNAACAVLVNAVNIDTVDLAINLICVTNESCSNANGSIYIEVAGHSPGYTYSWSNGATTQNLSFVAAGIYEVIVASTVCPVSDTAQIVVANTLPPTLSETHSYAACNNNGSINLTVNGGTPPYAFHWNNFSTNEDLNSISSGNYSVTVYDHIGCTATISVQIYDNSFTLSETHSATCDSSAYINLAVVGGAPPYNYLWNTGSNQEDLNNIPIGSYSVTVTDFNGCSNTDVIAIGTLPPPHPIINQTGNILNTSSSFVSYQWFLNNIPIAGATNYQYIPTQSGTYSVQATDANGCTGISTNVDVIINSVGSIQSADVLISFEVNNKNLLFHLADNTLMGAQIDIVNELGQLAASVTVTNQAPSADLSALSAGIYFYHIRSKQKTYSGKFIIE